MLTTLVVGVHLAANYSQHLPLFDLNISWAFFADIFKHPERLWAGAPYAFTLVLILLAHEMGHYLTCRHYGIDATYPYFFPAPTLIGTFGAFIRIKSPLATREELFDVGIAGPIAGFAVTLPALVVGVWHSNVMLTPEASNTILLGHPWAVGLLVRLFHPGMSASHLELSPVGCAAWVGLFLTALNLLPMGQLDGGHIVYAVLANRHRYVSLALFLALVPFGILFWGGWIFWAALMLVFGLRHPAPLIAPEQPLDPRRRVLAVLALAMFVLSFTISPFIVK
ncbi:MAG TPA: site-2 protease family protein [Terriglobia bacterium]|nr:site-2 protease family protein [Terriglobia bacterium]